MTSCEKCGIEIPKNQMRRLYGKYYVCEKCGKEWNETFAKLSLERHDLRGWRAWMPVFVQWLKNNIHEQVIFT